MGSPGTILNALESCKKLERLFIHSASNDVAVEAGPVISLMRACSNLTVLYLFIAPTPLVTCRAIKKHVENTFKAQRPPLSIQIHNSLPVMERQSVALCNKGDPDRSWPNYPSIHYRQMVALSPQVCVPTGFPDFN